MKYEDLFQLILINDPPIIDEFVLPVEIEDIEGVWSHLPARNKIRNINTTETQVDGKIQEVIDYYQQRKNEITDDFIRWYTHPNDNPNTIGQHLETQGFYLEYTLIAMVLNTQNYTPSNLNSEFHTREVEDVDEHLDLASKLWDFDWTEENRLKQKKLLTKVKYNYVYVFFDDIPVGVGMYQVLPDTNYVYFFRAGVADPFQKRGAYSHLLDYRVKIAKENNKQIATIANKTTSYPILKSKGFEELFEIPLYRYQLK